MNKKPLEVLNEKKLSGIVFVLDYLQIQFDSLVVTFMEYPKVKVNTSDYSFGASEYRNKICEFIGKTVSSTFYREDDLFSLDFGEGQIFCSLAPEDYTSPEMVIVDDGNGNIIAV